MKWQGRNTSVRPRFAHVVEKAERCVRGLSTAGFVKMSVVGRQLVEAWCLLNHRPLCQCIHNDVVLMQTDVSSRCMLCETRCFWVQSRIRIVSAVWH